MPKARKIEIYVFKNKFPVLFSYKTVDPICYYKDFVIY